MNRTWIWTARRLLISAFVVFHLGATIIWNMPACTIRQRTFDTVARYMTPLGLWQSWAMFAPDPIRDTLTLEADVTDARGLRHRFEFPKVADLSWWRAIPRYRHSKFVVNLRSEVDEPRKFAARHAIRELALPAGAFPLEVYLIFQVRDTPPPGGPPADPLAPCRTHVVAHYQIPTIDEVRP